MANPIPEPELAEAWASAKQLLVGTTRVLALNSPEFRHNMNEESKPTWNELPLEVRNAWIEQTHAFYPPGSTTIAEATELAQSEYEQGETLQLLEDSALEAEEA